MRAPPHRLGRLGLVGLLGLAIACTKGHADPGGPPGGKACTMIGCLDGVRVELAHAGAWAPGTYTFAVDLDGAVVTCTGALPLPACDAGPAITCDGEGVQVMESGCALEPAAQSFPEIMIPRGDLRELGLTVTLGGAPLVTTRMKPAYVESRPNGPECEPLCRSAGLRVDLP